MAVLLVRRETKGMRDIHQIARARINYRYLFSSALKYGEDKKLAGARPVLYEREEAPHTSRLHYFSFDQPINSENRAA